MKAYKIIKFNSNNDFVVSKKYLDRTSPFYKKHETFRLFQYILTKNNFQKDGVIPIKIIDLAEFFKTSHRKVRWDLDYMESVGILMRNSGNVIIHEYKKYL